MVVFVDVKLNLNSLSLAQTFLKEINSEVKFSDRGYGKVEFMLGQVLLLIKYVIGKKIAKLLNSNLNVEQFTSNDLLGDKHLKFNVVEPLTDIQAKILKSLLKVVCYQQDSNKKVEEFIIQEGQENMILSLFVEAIQFETCLHYTDTREKTFDLVNIHENIKNITAALSKTSFFDGKDLNARENYVIYLFYCLKDSEIQTKIANKDSVESYDENESDVSEDETAYSNSQSNMTNTGIALSNHILNLTTITLLPSKSFENLWESLHFDTNIKQKLFNYATISLKLGKYISKSGKNQQLTNNNSNRLILLHGPPGTGKTTLCKALFQKISMRCQINDATLIIDNQGSGILIELSCSKIFSRWFGESAKNLEILFTEIKNIIKHYNSMGKFVCLLIDEVEAIAYSRTDLLNKNETTDSIRVVSTLLTLLDSLRTFENILTLATSNLIGSLDAAFVDRADWIFYVNNPSERGITLILDSSIRELLNLNILSSPLGNGTLNDTQYQEILKTIAHTCFAKNMSGRILKKLPIKCISEYFFDLPVKLDDFLLAFAHTVVKLSDKESV
ncbi:hypothetical protein TPHA_0I01820 [Tetrapisispora phaffii CBS 4417]|uniref:AAA+ ATPase domain-containing protein n=1 Tax=Tetrapisispora phaffii (strain ATCC 24235 / CBS 4417 / NBRC 1672 / NRRL Y-8282 / UCD 70-5) TaxID=1071381 RepID=G8BXQ8_TETPH|nr:hypothetical protein TPHA_0I01820 [Tetrapisispora phaffii CBS 4417]CCE64686.1 hypothetical protein TPHA_0I01820 [Tetrapisispora phaffii CBS 4417]